MGEWVGEWVGSGKMTNLIKLELIDIIQFGNWKFCCMMSFCRVRAIFPFFHNG